MASIRQAGRFILSVVVGGYENTWTHSFTRKVCRPIDPSIYITQQTGYPGAGYFVKGGKCCLPSKRDRLKFEIKGAMQASVFQVSSGIPLDQWTGTALPSVSCALFGTPLYWNFQNPTLQQLANGGMRMSHGPRCYLSGCLSQPRWNRLSESLTIGLPQDLRVWIFECKTGKGKLLVSGIDLLSDKEKRPEARQLLYSLEKYMAGAQFAPRLRVEAKTINELFK